MTVRLPGIILRNGETAIITWRDNEIVELSLIDADHKAYATTELTAVLINGHPDKAAQLIRADWDTAIALLKQGR